MKRINRRIVLAGCVLTVIAAGSGVTAFAASDAASEAGLGNICIVTSHDPTHQTTQDLCVNWPSAR